MGIFKKENGTWKPATPSIKDGGTWKPSVETFIKVNGKWKSTNNASLLSATFSDFTIQSDAAGKYLTDGTQRLSLCTGKSVVLTGDGYIDVPINATLGGEGYSNFTIANFDALSTLIDNGDGSYTWDITQNSTNESYPRIQADLDRGLIPPNSNVVVEVSIVTNSGTPFIAYGDSIYLTSFVNNNIDISPYNDGNGNYVFTKNLTLNGDNGTFLIFAYKGDIPTHTGNYTISISIKEIQSTQGQISYYNFATKSHENPSLPLSTTYQLKDLEFNNLAVLWDRSFTQADRDKMDADPELLVRWALGEDVGFSIGVKDTKDKVYIGSEDGRHLLEVGYSEGAELLGSPHIDSNWTDNMDGTYTSDGSNGTLSFASVPKMLDKLYMKALSVVELNAGEVTFPYDNSGGITATYVNGMGKHIEFSKSFKTVTGTTLIYSAGFNGTIKDYSLKQITSDYLTINGTYKRVSGKQQGLQTALLEMNDAGVPTGVAPAKTLNMNSGYLEMKWNPDTPSYTIEVTDDGKVKKLTHNPDKFTVDGADATPVNLPDPKTFLHFDKNTMDGLIKLTQPLKINFYKVV